MRFFLVVFALVSTSCFGQKTTSFYENLFQFNYPSNPVPELYEVYSLVSNIVGADMVTFDYRGEKLILHELKINPVGYGVNNDQIAPKLFAFDKYPIAQLPKDKGFLITADLSDIEFYHKPTETTGKYEIHYSFNLFISVGKAGRIFDEKQYSFQEIAGEFYTQLQGADVHIVATNKATALAKTLNDALLKKSGRLFRNYIRATMDLSFTKQSLKFFGISKLKKLQSESEIRLLDTRLGDLKKLDKIFDERDNYENELQEIVKTLEQLRESPDYKMLPAYRFYIHGNLASLYTLLTHYELARANYEHALANAEKERFRAMITEEQEKMEVKWRNRQTLLNANTAISVRYAKVLETRKSVIN